MIYRNFRLERFRGVTDVTISLTRGDLVLLLGLNESGKTTILKGIEAFDSRNDPEGESARTKFLSSVRNLADMHANEPAVITAKIGLDDVAASRKFTQTFRRLQEDLAVQQLFEALWARAVDVGELTIKRVFPFKDGHPDRPHYRFEDGEPFNEHRRIASIVAEEIIHRCPSIIYFEDFTDRIPDRIMASPQSDAFNPEWFAIIDGLFHSTDEKLSIKRFGTYFSPKKPRTHDAKTAMKRVNKKLNDVFTSKWSQLSGVKDIAETELVANFSKSPKHFEIRITDSDGTTFSVDERSKGALWYLSFLMKTEFRRKKMRRDSGKPVFLIDEPASDLHSSAQQNMVEDFAKLVEDTSVVYSTHSQYLISLAQIRNAHVVRRDDGTTTATKWGDYLREHQSEVSHFQPLANLLQLLPNDLAVPWRRAVITEGPSDKSVLQVMHRAIHGTKPDFVVYPGTSAHNLGTLISLNLGWGSAFRVLLDGDRAGDEAHQRYESDFSLPDGTIVRLAKGKKIEDYFTAAERAALCEEAFGEKPQGGLSKKQFAHAMALFEAASDGATRVASLVGRPTFERFEKLISAVAPPNASDP